MSSIDLPPPSPLRSPVAGAAPPQATLAPRDAMTPRPVAAADEPGVPPQLDPRGLQRPDETLLFRARSLALARDEERRLEQRLSDLRRSIEATEQILRTMQADALGPSG